MSTSKSNFWSSPLTKSRITSDDVKMPEMLLGYFIGPFGALLSSGIFTCILQNYFTDVLKLDLGFLTTLQLVSTVLIVASNLIVGQLIEHTRALAGKARPWILLSALTLSVASVLMFIVPFEGMAKMVWIAIAYNLYYAVAYPIYNTANSTMIPVSTRDSKQRGALASFTNVAGLGVMGCGSMVFPMLVSFALKEDQHLWFLTMLAIAIFSALTIYLQFLFTRERVTEEGRADTDTPAKSATLGEQLKAVTGDRMWWDRHGVLYAVPVERRDEERLHELFLQMGSGQHFLRHGGRMGRLPGPAQHHGRYPDGRGCGLCGTPGQQVR